MKKDEISNLGNVWIKFVVLEESIEQKDLLNEKTYISMTPMVSPGSPNIAIVSNASGGVVSFEQFLQNAGHVRDTFITVLFDYKAVHFFHAIGERVIGNNPGANLSEEVAT